MRSRPQSHVLEQKAAAALTALFAEAGWSLEPIRHDYGEDFLVSIFDSGAKTPWKFFVQSKAVTRTRGILVDRGRALSVRVATAHVRLWALLAIPVVLTLFDAHTGRLYWHTVSTRDLARGRRRAATLTIRLSVDQRLTAPALAVLRHLAIARHERHDLRTLAAARYRECIKSCWGVDIEIADNPNVIMLPKGQFHPAPSGEEHVFLYGYLADVARRKNWVRRKGDGEVVLDKVIERRRPIFHEEERRIKAGRFVTIKGPFGRIRRRFRSVRELIEWYKTHGVIGIAEL